MSARDGRDPRLSAAGDRSPDGAIDRRTFLRGSSAALAAFTMFGTTACGGGGGGGGDGDDEPRVRADAAPATPGTSRILIAGGGFQSAFIAYLAALTGKERPRLCFLPTAAADRPSSIEAWYAYCSVLDVEPSHQEVFISSYEMTRSWEDVLLSVDGIVVSGGNTLNQIAIWRAQGIDAVLREAWQRGIVLGGASAGSLCWFEEGTTDSRPQALSRVEGLGFLPGSHSPHYDAEAERRPTYQRLIRSGELAPGWACDNDAGIYFEGTTPMRFLSTRDGAGVYYVDLVEGEVVETAHETTRIRTTRIGG